MAAFDAYLMVDWSAASTPAPANPVRAKDSIWWALGVSDGDALAITDHRHARTRREAVEALGDLLEGVLRHGRVLACFDFAFGYPAGTAAALGLSGLTWRKLWSAITEAFEEGSANDNNRFAVADMLNRRIGGPAGPFWSHPPSHKGRYADLPFRKPAGYGEDFPAERRRAEDWAKGAKSVWQLSGAGVVGGQTLSGIPALWQLRTDPRFASRAAIWPFETGLADDPRADLVIAETWPSLFPPEECGGLPLDAGQVLSTVRHLHAADRQGLLEAWFAGPADLSGDDRQKIEGEEGWILGPVGADQPMPEMAARPPVPALGTPSYDYIREPEAIYAESFRRVREATRLDAIPEGLHELVIRLVHSAARPEITDSLQWEGNPAEAGRKALSRGAPILVDAAMVASGITARFLPAGNALRCTLNDDAVPGLAKRLGTTRSAAAVELWRDHIDGAVVAIGNAPTALFHLLERLRDGWPRPAAILAFPVGFVGAAESKQALIDADLGIPFITLTGRDGGSSLAAAAVNAIALSAGVQR